MWPSLLPGLPKGHLQPKARLGKAGVFVNPGVVLRRLLGANAFHSDQVRSNASNKESQLSVHAPISKRVR